MGHRGISSAESAKAWLGQGLGSVLAEQPVVVAPQAQEDAAFIARAQVNQAKRAEVAAKAIPGYSDSVQDAGLNNGTRKNRAKKKAGITTKSDNTYLGSLKIDSVERYNELLAKKAFHPGNADVKAIAKQLGINQNGKARKKRAPKAPVEVAPAVGTTVSTADTETVIPKGQTAVITGNSDDGYTSIEQGLAEQRAFQAEMNAQPSGFGMNGGYDMGSLINGMAFGGQSFGVPQFGADYPLNQGNVPVATTIPGKGDFITLPK